VSITREIDLETFDTPHCPECGQDIDTWAVEKRAIERERERIIKLLEEQLNLCTEKDNPNGCIACQGMRASVALIKERTSE